MDNPDKPSNKRRYTAPGQPRLCRFIDDEGNMHGIELTEENSYNKSTYCKEHHAIMAARSRDRNGPRPGQRYRRKPGEARSCGFIMPDGGRHGIALTDENSFKTSQYCKEHHNVMVMQARQAGPGRESNIKRVTEYKNRNREEVNRKRRELRAAKVLAAERGISVASAKLMLAPTPPALPATIPRCFKSGKSRKWHIAGAGLVALCINWRAAPGAEMVELPADSPDLCAACRKRWLEKAAKEAKR